MIYLSRLIKLM